MTFILPARHGDHGLKMSNHNVIMVMDFANSIFSEIRKELFGLHSRIGRCVFGWCLCFVQSAWLSMTRQSFLYTGTLYTVIHQVYEIFHGHTLSPATV